MTTIFYSKTYYFFSFFFFVSYPLSPIPMLQILYSPSEVYVLHKRTYSWSPKLKMVSSLLKVVLNVFLFKLSFKKRRTYYHLSAKDTVKFPSMYQVLGLIFSVHELGMVVHACDPSTQEVETVDGKSRIILEAHHGYLV